MPLLIPIAMFGYIPVVLLLFWLLPARRAVIAAFLLGWLFLPPNTLVEYKIAMLPVYSKYTATPLVTLLGVFLFDSHQLFAFRPKLLDLPVIIWCMSKIGSSVSNGYGVYDGISAAEYNFIFWSLPWLLGRLYFSDNEGLKELAVGMVVGGLLYTPLCLYEAKMSPQSQLWIYGISVDLVQTRRFGGWRPVVFMQHGLMVGLWVCMSALMAWWLWLTGAVKKVWGMPMSWAAVILLVTSVLIKSLGAVALLIVGIGVLWGAHKLRRTWPLWAALLFAVVYMAVRLTGVWSGGGLIELAGLAGDSDRVLSLECRLNSEDQFIRAGWYRPLLGFRNWGNTKSLQSTDTEFGIADAMWMIEFTGSGLIGLACLTLYLTGPPGRSWRQITPRDWSNTAIMPAVGLGVVVTMWMIDNLFNGMLHPVFMMAAGGLAAWSVKAVVARRKAAAPVRSGHRLPAVRVETVGRGIVKS